MKKFLASLVFLIGLLSLPSPAQQDYNFNVGGLGYSSGASVPASCSRDGSWFWKNVGTKSWYVCSNGTYAAVGLAGGGTITAVNPGNGLSGGGSSGAVSLAVAPPTVVTNASQTYTAGSIQVFPVDNTLGSDLVLGTVASDIGGGTVPVGALYIIVNSLHNQPHFAFNDGNSGQVAMTPSDDVADFAAGATGTGATVKKNSPVLSGNPFLADFTANSGTFNLLNYNVFDYSLSPGGTASCTFSATAGHTYGCYSATLGLTASYNGDAFSKVMRLSDLVLGNATQHLLNTTFFDDVTASAATRGDGMFAVGATPKWTRIGHSSATGGYFKWNGTDVVASTLAASGTGSPTACTNQAVTGFTLNGDAAPTSSCNTITSNYVDSTVCSNGACGQNTTGSSASISTSGTYIKTASGTANASTTSQQNKVLCSGFTTGAYGGTYTTFSYNVNTADNTANLYDIGIALASTGARVCHTGAIAGTSSFPASGIITVTATGNCVLAANTKYYTTLTSSAASPLAKLGGELQPTFQNSATACGTSSSGVIPDPLTAVPADSWSQGTVPTIAIHN